LVPLVPFVPEVPLYSMCMSWLHHPGGVISMQYDV
jgi:hypothetical protein